MTSSLAPVSSWESVDSGGSDIAIFLESALSSRFSNFKYLSKGAFGTIFLAEDRLHTVYAIKVQKQTRDELLLKAECSIYKRLFVDRISNFPTKGIPMVYDYLNIQNYEIMVMERLGDSLKSKMEQMNSKTFSKKTGLMLGIQCVQRIQTLHENHILHRDIKASNFCMGQGYFDNTVYIIDFGLSEYRSTWDYDVRDTHSFGASSGHVSGEALLDSTPTRAHDLTSLLYSLIEMVTGEIILSMYNESTGELLLLSMREPGFQKIRRGPLELCENFPELLPFATTVFQTIKGSKPDYNGMVRNLEQGLSFLQCENDGVFDWLVEKPDEEQQEKSSAEVGENEKSARDASYLRRENLGEKQAPNRVPNFEEGKEALLGKVSKVPVKAMKNQRASKQSPKQIEKPADPEKNTGASTNDEEIEARTGHSAVSEQTSVEAREERKEEIGSQIPQADMEPEQRKIEREKFSLLLSGIVRLVSGAVDYMKLPVASSRVSKEM